MLCKNKHTNPINIIGNDNGQNILVKIIHSVPIFSAELLSIKDNIALKIDPIIMYATQINNIIIL